MISAMTSLVVVHTLLSLAGIVAGFAVLYGFVTANRLDTWTAAFLAATAATSLVGFLFASEQTLPLHKLGITSLVVVAAAFTARYVYKLAGMWRTIFVAAAVLALYLNVFLGIVQAFRKIPALHALAPTQTEPPYLTAQFLALVLFIVGGIVCAIRFHPAPR